MLWELYQQSQISAAKDHASRAESKTRDVNLRIDHLEDRFESLALTCQALWEIARDRSGLTDDQLLAKVTEIDGRDGLVDGKMSSGPVRCAACGRNNGKRRLSCIYCGKPIVKEHVFQH